MHGISVEKHTHTYTKKVTIKKNTENKEKKNRKKIKLMKKSLCVQNSDWCSLAVTSGHTTLYYRPRTVIGVRSKSDFYARGPKNERIYIYIYIFFL